MGENSKIAWTHHTFNPWVGCQRISPGCTNCYAEAYDRRVGGRPKSQRKDPEVPEFEPSPLNREQREATMKVGLGIDWVIIGGESGPGARPFDLDWARDLVRQCRRAGVAPFVKQLGANVACQECGRRSICVGRYEGHGEEGASCDECCGHGNEDGHCHQLTDPAGADPDEWPTDLRVREFPR